MSSAGKEFDEWFAIWYRAQHDQLSAAMRDAREDIQAFPRFEQMFWRWRVRHPIQYWRQREMFRRAR